MEKRDILLTIGIPNYNRAGLLKMLVESIISQIRALEDDASQVEIFVCDDKSKDDSVGVVKSLIYDNSDVNIRVVANEENLFFSGNFSKTIKDAVGEFVFIMSNDDGLAPGALSKIINIIKLHQDIALGFVASQAYDSTLSHPIKECPIGEDKFYPQGVDLIKEINACVPCLCSGWLVRKDVWTSFAQGAMMSSVAAHIPVGMAILAEHSCYYYRSSPLVYARKGAEVSWSHSSDPLWPYSGLDAYFQASYVIRDKYPTSLYRKIYWQTIRTACGHTIRNKVLNISINVSAIESLLGSYYDYSWPCVIWTFVFRFLLRAPKWMLYVPFRWLVPERL